MCRSPRRGGVRRRPSPESSAGSDGAHILCSPLLRTRETAGIALGAGRDLHHDDDLREIDFGRWEGMSFAEIAAADPAAVDRWAALDEDFAFPGGEGIGAFRERIGAAAGRIAADPAGTVVAITHGGVIRLLICRFLGLDYRHYLLFDVRPASISEIRIEGGRGVLTRLNDAPSGGLMQDPRSPEARGVLGRTPQRQGTRETPQMGVFQQPVGGLANGGDHPHHRRKPERQERLRAEDGGGPPRPARLRRDLPRDRSGDGGTGPEAPRGEKRMPTGRRSRRPSIWPAPSAGPAAYRVILVDCLTLWVNNLLYEAEKRGKVFTEEAMAGRCRELIDACGAFPGTVIFVTNELGMGIIPDNEPARRFRDCAGRCNQLIAAAAVTVTLVVSGLPLLLKSGACGIEAV